MGQSFREDKELEKRKEKIEARSQEKKLQLTCR